MYSDWLALDSFPGKTIGQSYFLISSSEFHFLFLWASSPPFHNTLWFSSERPGNTSHAHTGLILTAAQHGRKQQWPKKRIMGPSQYIRLQTAFIKYIAETCLVGKSWTWLACGHYWVCTATLINSMWKQIAIWMCEETKKTWRVFTICWSRGWWCASRAKSRPFQHW